MKLTVLAQNTYLSMLTPIPMVSETILREREIEREQREREQRGRERESRGGEWRESRERGIGVNMLRYVF